jgi:hypothetical protein
LAKIHGSSSFSTPKTDSGTNKANNLPISDEDTGISPGYFPYSTGSKVDLSLP